MFAFAVVSQHLARVCRHIQIPAVLPGVSTSREVEAEKERSRGRECVCACECVSVCECEFATYTQRLVGLNTRLLIHCCTGPLPSRIHSMCFMKARMFGSAPFCCANNLQVWVRLSHSLSLTHMYSLPLSLSPSLPPSVLDMAPANAACTTPSPVDLTLGHHRAPCFSVDDCNRSRAQANVVSCQRCRC